MFTRSALTLLTGTVLGGILMAASASAQSIPYTAPTAAPAPAYSAPQPQPGYGYSPSATAAPAPNHVPPAATYQPAPQASQTLDQQYRQLPQGYTPSVPQTQPQAYGQPQTFGQPMTTTVPSTTAYSPDYPAPMPAPQSLNQATPAASNESFFISGGVGKAERDRLEAMKGQYNLHVQMATSNGAFVSGVNVQITDAKGTTVLETVTDGPLLMAKLPAGKYKVSASKFGETKTQTVQVGEKAGKSVNVFWKQDA